MEDAWIQTTSNRYIELYEKVIGEKFVAEEWTNEQTFKAVEESLSRLSPPQL
jgi:phosphoribosylaminoimidazole-succinocarboxamide synthase